MIASKFPRKNISLELIVLLTLFIRVITLFIRSFVHFFKNSEAFVFGVSENLDFPFDPIV